ncbi:MAG TPA: signal peptidase I [Streptosporangiaceae bacterium]
MMDEQSTHEAALAGGVTGEAGPGPADPGDLAAGSGPGAPGEADEPGARGVRGDGGEPSDQGADAPRRRRSFWRELPVLIVIALVIALLIKNFVVQAFYIPSPSMEHTLNVGDKVLVNKLVYDFRDIQPGDIIVFNGAGSWDPVPPPVPSSTNPLVRLYDAAIRPLFRSVTGLFGTAPGQQDYIKRVIGVPGDKVACCTNGKITVNGVPLSEKSYLFPGDTPSLTHFSTIVPPGRLWVMGDHRVVSYDSRGHMADPGNGTIPESQVVGRAFMIVWPAGQWRVLPIPATFGQPGVTSGKAAAGAALRSGGAAGAVPAAAPGPVMVQPAAPLLPLELGFAGAIPLTWLQRRFRLRLRRRPAGGRAGRAGRARRGRPGSGGSGRGGSDGGGSDGGRSDRGHCDNTGHGRAPGRWGRRGPAR